jgi:hypothetical protein
MKMNTQVSRFIRPVMQALCIALIAAAASVMTQAQEITPVVTSIIDVTPDGFPLTLQHDYELGSETWTYDQNGEYTGVAPATLGAFKSVTVGNITVPVGGSTEVWFGGCLGDLLVDWFDGCIRIRIRRL